MIYVPRVHNSWVIGNQSFNNRYFHLISVIGRGGEQITRLQSETGCKIQMAPESGGLPERVCTLTGSREAVK